MRIEASVSATGVDEKGNIAALTRITRHGDEDHRADVD